MATVHPGARSRWKSVYRRVPKIEVFRGRGGRFEGMHVSLQRKGLKAVRGLTPNPVVMVDVGIDAKGRPVFLSLSEPVDSATLVRTIRLFLAGFEGTTGRGPPARRRAPVSDPATVELLLRAVEEVAPRLAPWPVHPATQRRALSA